MRKKLSSLVTQRCDGKTAYRGWGLAERQAELATARAGGLIIAYECPDCGALHIGHADLSKRMAREIHTDRACLQCGAMIHEAKRQKARQWGSPILYCSAACRRLAASKRYREKNNREVVGP
jgi:predicted RNA-binding Zn-ribbon protein involved in translation (DUF1610 family)